MQPVPAKKTFLQKQIPTLIGLGVLVVALVVGIIFLGQGGGVFAPRATPETTPKLIKVTDVAHDSFTVSFLTDESTSGFVRYGKEADKLKSQSSDNRDQLSGSVGKYTMHHITVRGLEPDTSYFYALGTGSNKNFDNDGTPFTIRTTKRGGTPSAAKTIYGTVTGANGASGEGSVVYITINGVGEMSSLVRGSNSWAVALSNARTTDGSAYATIKDTDVVNISVQGPQAGQTSQLSTTVKDAQPVPAITLGQNGAATAALPSPSASPTDTASTSGLIAPPNGGVVAPPPSTGGLSNLVGSSSAKVASGSGTLAASASAVVDLTKTTDQVVTTTQPVIKGTAKPGVTVKIQVNSETQLNYELVADANGGFKLDIAALSKQLEPGEHTVTYSYVDPATGEEVTKTETFTVAAGSTAGTPATTSTSNQLALASPTASPKASPSPSPYGSGNPYSITSPSPSASTSSATKGASSSSRVSYPATTSGIPVSGSVGATLALVIGGLFFVIAGAWSFWIAQRWDEVVNSDE